MAESDLTIDLSLHMPAQPVAAGVARRLVRVLEGFLDSGTLDTVTLLVSELITNSLRHARHSADNWVELSLHLGQGAVSADVVNPGPGFQPAPITVPESDSCSGRGLLLLDRLADRWGVETEGASAGASFEEASPEEASPEEDSPEEASRVWFRLGGS